MEKGKITIVGSRSSRGRSAIIQGCSPAMLEHEFQNVALGNLMLDSMASMHMYQEKTDEEIERERLANKKQLHKMLSKPRRKR